MPADLFENATLADVLREKLQSSDGELLGQGYQATVHRYESPVGDVVVKSPHESALLGRLGQITIRREHNVYKRLDGIAGIPRCYGLLDGRHLVLEAVDGVSLRTQGEHFRDREAFFARLLGVIQNMHAAGIAHGDLKRKDNVIVTDEEQPYLIDFGVACADGGGFTHRRFEWLKQLDLNAWIKLKHGRNRDTLPPTDAALYKPLLIEKLARAIRIPWQTLTLRRTRQRWRR